MNVTDENSRIRIRIRLSEPEVGIRGSGSVPKCHGSATLLLNHKIGQKFTVVSGTGTRAGTGTHCPPKEFGHLNRLIKLRSVEKISELRSAEAEEYIANTRQGWKKPGFFLKKPHPSGFFLVFGVFGVFWGFWGFLGFFIYVP